MPAKNHPAKQLLLNSVATTVLKGLAIVAVVVIHYFSLIKQSPFWNNSDWQWQAVFIDRFTRLSVPLFVALSGYGLSQKYFKNLNLSEFVKNRLFKLLPPYLIWSVFYFFFAWFYYGWQMTGSISGFVELLVLGRVDYHLYFVPMIFQLYIIFPALFLLWKKAPTLTLISSLIFQIAWLWFFSYHNQAPLNLKYFINDVEQYFWSPNWIWYFVLGFHIPKIITWIDGQKLFFKASLFIATLASWLWLSFYSLEKLRDGMNALNVLRFTQYPTMIFATIGIVFIAWSFAKIKSFPAPLIWLGKYSYQIYLSHYLWLRLLFQLILK